MPGRPYGRQVGGKNSGTEKNCSGISFPIVNEHEATKLIASCPAKVLSPVPKGEGPGAPIYQSVFRKWSDWPTRISQGLKPDSFLALIGTTEVVPFHGTIYGARSSAHLLAIRKPEACSYNIQNGQRKQKLPTKVHQLVIAEARQRASHPDIQTEKTKNFAHEPEER